MITKKDALGKDLAEGDYVLLANSRHYIHVGIVYKQTACMVRFIVDTYHPHEYQVLPTGVGAYVLNPNKLKNRYDSCPIYDSQTNLAGVLKIDKQLYDEFKKG